MKLWSHQRDQIKPLSNFKTGIHCHATGAGKTITTINIIIEFNKRYNNKSILWFTEKKYLNR